MLLTKLKQLTESRMFWLGAIFLLGVFIYFYKLDKIPSGFYIDEALPGYNAYSLLLTGKDEYGKLLPVVLRFYGSYNPFLFTYLVIPSIAFFELNVFSVRFISALAGLLSMFVVYSFLHLSGILKEKVTPLLGALFLIISPWAILHSRVGYEVSLGFLFLCLGTLFLWRSLTDSKFLVHAMVFLSLSTYAAYAQRYVVPMILLGFILIYKKKLLSKRYSKHIKTAFLIGLVSQIPNIYILFTPAFFPKSNLLGADIIAAQAGKILFLPYNLSFVLSYIREFFSQYVAYFSPKSLFFLPDPDLQRSVPELSVFYFWMVIPYFVGIYILWKNKTKNFSKFVFLLALVAPVPAALTRDPFSTHRAMPLLLPLILVISVGMDTLINKFPKIGTFLTSFLVVFSLLLLWRSYFVFLPQERAKVWGYGHKQLAEEIRSRPESNFIIDQSRIKPAYIQMAFYLKYPPAEFQKQVDPSIKDNYYDKQDFNAHYKFANIETRNILWEDDIYKQQILVGDEYAISTQQAKEHFLEPVFEIRSPVDEIIFVGFATNPDKKCESDPDNVHCRGI